MLDLIAHAYMFCPLVFMQKHGLVDSFWIKMNVFLFSEDARGEKIKPHL